MDKGVPYEMAWQMNPFDALDILGLSADKLKSNAGKTQVENARLSSQPASNHSYSQSGQSLAKDRSIPSDGRKLVAKYRKSKMQT